MRGHRSSFRRLNQNQTTFEQVTHMRPTLLRRVIAPSLARDHRISRLVHRFDPPSDDKGDRAESTV